MTAYSIASAATALGVSYKRVQRAIYRGGVKPTQAGCRWVLFEDDLVTLRDHLASLRPGRPRAEKLN